jgi:hypothetical protein
MSVASIWNIPFAIGNREPLADRVLEEHPRDVLVAVLQPRDHRAEPVQLLVDVHHPLDRFGGLVLAVPELELAGLNEDSGDSSTQA